MLALQGVSPEELRRAIPELLPHEARKIVAHVQRMEPLDGPVREVRREALARVRERGNVPSLSLLRTERSALDPFVKHALSTHDGHVLETVRIPLEKPGRTTVCVSSQAGCALACAFCATGKLGLLRNLEAWEIVEQVRVVLRSLSEEQAGRARIHGVVFQGMGEPLANLERVLAAVRVMTDPSALAIDGRNITVCTAGLPTGIRALAERAKKLRLALSLHSAKADVRAEIMPIAKTHALDDVLEAAAFHATHTGLAPLWAVTLLADINDGEDDAQRLADLVQAFAQKTGVIPQVSVIPYNPIGPSDAFARSSDEVTRAFLDHLHARRVFARLRYSGGGDIGAACGQLAGQQTLRKNMDLARSVAPLTNDKTLS